MLLEPEMGGVSIVLVGQFNPPIVTPQWLARHSLVSGEEADNAEIGVIHKEIT